MSLTNRSSNFYQFFQYYLPESDSNYIVENKALSSVQVGDEAIFNFNNFFVDGTGINFRKIVFSWTAAASNGDIEIIGRTEFHTSESDLIEVPEDDETASSDLLFSQLTQIKFTGWDLATVISIGFEGGETPWVTPMFYNQSHQIISDGTANWTVEGTLEGNWKPKQSKYSPDGDLYRFPLNSSLTAQTATTVTPVQSTLPVGGMKIKLNSGVGNIRWRVGNNMYM